jgi:hypothetical protein
MATMVPDRGNDPKRKLKYSDMSVETVKPSGEHTISHFQDGVLHSTRYIGYTKKQAMKIHKDEFEKGK